jgi:RNA polymerase sigma-70 factor (ECF subfamily)
MNDRNPYKSSAVTRGTPDEPSVHAEQAESLSLAFLLLLERLGPAERTVFLLHDVFGRGRAEIAAIVGESEQACEQHLLRSRRALRAAKTSIEATRRRRDAVAVSFFLCVGQGDVARAAEFLAPDVVAYVSGVTKGDTQPEPSLGRRAVVRRLDALSRQLRQEGITVQLDRLGGQPRACLRDRAGRRVGTLSVAITDGLLQTIRFGRGVTTHAATSTRSEMHASGTEGRDDSARGAFIRFAPGSNPARSRQSARSASARVA